MLEFLGFLLACLWKIVMVIVVACIALVCVYVACLLIKVLTGGVDE